MKKLFISCIALLFVASACKDGYIDELQSVAPGTDAEAPVVTVAYPLEGTLIRVTEDVTPIEIQFTVSDDIEIKDITVQLNGTSVATFNEFMDFRKVIESFTYDNLTNGQHTLAVIATDLSGKSTTHTVNFEKVEPYRPIYDGEVFYMPFDGDNVELMTIRNATRLGNPGFEAAGRVGAAYAGATDSYLTIPTEGLTNPDFSAVFWYKLNATPDRGGLLTISPAHASNNLRTSGFRVFRENVGGKQRITLNVGNGSADSWFNSDAAYHLDPADDEWVHVAFSITNGEAILYINGEVAAQQSFSGISWAGCEILSIGSGAPNFTEWNHRSDLSNIDELRIFDKVLSQAEIQAIINAES